MESKFPAKTQWVDWKLSIEGTGDLTEFEVALSEFINGLREKGHYVPKYEVSSRNA